MRSSRVIGALLLCLCLAVANAIFNAVGVRIDELPITPEKVLRAIKAQGGARPQGLPGGRR